VNAISGRPTQGGTVGQRSGDQDAEPELRQYLLADHVDFRHRMCTILAEDPSWSREAWRQLSHSVDALANGKEYRLHAWELPDGHWALVHGINAVWVLGCDDVLRVVS
jgi:hypothetical protein